MKLKLLNFSSKDIIKAIENEDDIFAKRKLQAFLLVKEGLKISSVSEKFSILSNSKGIGNISNSFRVRKCPNTLYVWIKQIKKEGFKNLKIKPGRDLKPLLNENQFNELKKTLSELFNFTGIKDISYSKGVRKQIKTEDGYNRGWQTKDVIGHVKDKYQVSYSPSRMRELLRILGLRKITCRPRSKRRNENLTNEFLNNVKKNEIC